MLKFRKLRCILGLHEWWVCVWHRGGVQTRSVFCDLCGAEKVE